jgi:hypothetical protein
VLQNSSSSKVATVVRDILENYIGLEDEEEGAGPDVNADGRQYNFDDDM